MRIEEPKHDLNATWTGDDGSAYLPISLVVLLRRSIGFLERHTVKSQVQPLYATRDEGMVSRSFRFGSILYTGAIFWQRAQCHVASELGQVGSSQHAVAHVKEMYH